MKLTIGLVLINLFKSMKVNKDSISYCLSTVSPNGPNGLTFPESRFCVHRGFVNERRKPNDGSSNPDKPEQTGNAMMFCTDIRSPKIDQLVNRKEDVQDGQSASVCWWFADSGEQYRIRALTYIVPPPSLELEFPKFIPSDKKLNPLNLGSLEFNWESERKRVFEKVSPELQASFLRSIPGEALENLSNDQLPKTYWPTKINTDEEKSKALDRFALVILDPISIDL
uniref:Orf-3 n=1 Tax=Melampsora lini TaxID=5261 RepID=Q6R654_MELLI|nr:orf-3 [Melampsora lini]AAS66954.1 orf-3 [Melampsora lini]